MKISKLKNKVQKVSKKKVNLSSLNLVNIDGDNNCRINIKQLRLILLIKVMIIEIKERSQWQKDLVYKLRIQLSIISYTLFS